MPPAIHPLANVQRWMQAVMTHPEGLDAGAATDGQSSWKIDDVIEPSGQLSSYARLEIYAHAYTARLLEVMTSEYPSLQQALGEELFHDFVMGYLEEFPSTSYTLSELGRAFPDYLATSRPERDGDDPDWADFLIDLARLERIYSEVFDGPGTEGHPPLDLAAIASQDLDSWAESRLVAAPSLRLVTLRFPAHEYVTGVRRQESPEFPDASPTHLVISRRDFVVRRAAVSEPEFRVLEALQTGATIADAVELSVADDQVTNDAQAVVRIRNWFEEWFRAGYFTSIAKSTSPTVWHAP